MARIGSHQVPTRTLLLIGVDVAAVVLVVWTATVLRFRTLDSISDPFLWGKIGVFTIVCWFSLYVNDLYDFGVVRRRADLLVHTMQALGASCLVLAVVYFIAPSASLGRGIALTAAPVLVVVLLSWRLSSINLLANGDERILIMGTAEAGVSLVRHILGHPEYNMKVVGFLDEAGQNIGKSLVNPRIVGATAEVQEIVEREQIDRVVLSLKERRGVTPVHELLNLKLSGIRIEDVHSCFERLSGRIALEHLSPSWLILSDGFRKSSILLAVKRTVDFVVSSFILLLVSPLLPVIALAIYLETGLPILFRQTRVGYRGKEFEVLKFRSMVQDAEKNGPQWASDHDSRVTRVGRVLRKIRLDEIPQLFNVFCGHMSLVGPRPERPVFCEMLKENIPFFQLRHSIRPGLTGWAQVRFRYSANLEDSKGKLELDLFYLKNLSLWVDFAILFETVKIVLLRRGAR